MLSGETVGTGNASSMIEAIEEDQELDKRVEAVFQLNTPYRDLLRTVDTILDSRLPMLAGALRSTNREDAVNTLYSIMPLLHGLRSAFELAVVTEFGHRELNDSSQNVLKWMEANSNNYQNALREIDFIESCINQALALAGTEQYSSTSETINLLPYQLQSSRLTMGNAVLEANIKAFELRLRRWKARQQSPPQDGHQTDRVNRHPVQLSRSRSS